jgi:enoyl-CoA hydratase/carnithine racemase
MSDIEVSTTGGVCELRLNRPKKKNALTLAMYRAVTEALASANEDSNVRVVLVTAAGDAFCAGNDLMDFATAGDIDVESAPAMQFIRALVNFAKPIVVAVNGAAAGVGATMLLHADLVYASEDAALSMPFVNLGLVPEAASSLLLPARIGLLAASEMLLLGTAIDAIRAKELGLVNQPRLVAVRRQRQHALHRSRPGGGRHTRTDRRVHEGQRSPNRRVPLDCSLARSLGDGARARHVLLRSR